MPAGQPDEQAQTAWVHEGQVPLDEPDLPPQQDDSVIVGKTVDAVYQALVQPMTTSPAASS